MATNPKPQAPPPDLEPPLIGELLDREIACRAVPEGVLVIDHYALLDLLDKLEADEIGASAMGPASPAKRRPRPLDPEAPNPVGVIQEYCQGLGKPIPEYRFDFIGHENLPLFRCTASALGKTGEAEANSKSQAKERAARGLIHGLQKARRERHG